MNKNRRSKKKLMKEFMQEMVMYVVSLLSVVFFFLEIFEWMLTI